MLFRSAPRPPQQEARSLGQLPRGPGLLCLPRWHSAPKRSGSPGGEELMPLGPCRAHPLSGSGHCPRLAGAREASLPPPSPPPSPPGKTCQQADPCASNPCANGGQCLPFEASYICHCPAGFHGPTCRQDVNECSQSPGLCHHGGTCLNEVGSYRCVCRPTHTGPHCELPHVPCSPSPCQNGGTCRPTGDTTHECACLPGTARRKRAGGGEPGRLGLGASPEPGWLECSPGAGAELALGCRHPPTTCRPWMGLL